MAGVRTFCRVGEPACDLLATVDGGELTAVGDHPISRGLACNKGIAAPGASTRSATWRI
jgi:hypothetical protein